MSATVARISLDEPLQPVELEPGHEQALLVAIVDGSVIGEVLVPGPSPISPDRQRAVLAEAVGERLWRHTLRRALKRSAGLDEATQARQLPSVAVVVCTRHRPDDLDRCLASIGALARAPREVVVVDNSEGDVATAEVCGRHSVRRVVEPVPGLSRARNRGIAETDSEVVAFIDDDCVVDARWLESPLREFADPLVMVVAGYVGPFELDTPAQYAFESLGGFARAFERVVLDGRYIRWAGIGDGNSFFRRSVFEEVGLFAEDLGPGTPAMSGQDADVFARIFGAGYRLVLDPAAIAWHRHRLDHDSLRAAIFGWSTGFSAYVTRSLFSRRDPRALRYGSWWPRHMAKHAIRGLRRPAERVSGDLLRAGVKGTLAGPWRLLKSSRAESDPLPRSVAARAAPSGSARVNAEAGPELSVAIASRNRRDLLLETLTALGRQSYPGERVEVVVVLDGTEDDSATAIRGLEAPYELQVIEQEKRGTGATKNRGLSATSKPVVVFLDDDIVPDGDFLAAHAQAHADAGGGLVSLGYYPPATADRSFWALEIRAWWEDYFRRAAEPNHQWTFVDMAEGNFSTRREVLLDVGGWDEDFTGGRRQDWELGARLLKNGAQLSHNRDARGSHRLDTSYATAVRNARQEGRWDVVLARKHPELTLRLPFADFARAEGGTMSRRGRMAYEHGAAATRVNRMLVAQVARMERLGLHRQWRALSWVVLANEYVQGVASELPSLDMLKTFVAEAATSLTTMPLVIGDKLDSTANPVAATDVEARCGDTKIAQTRAPLPAEQWDWESVVERLVAGAPVPPPPDHLRCVAGQAGPGAADVLTAWGEQ